MKEESSRKQVDRVASDHGHWRGFDEHLEMLEFERLQFMCRVGETVVDGDWNRLVRLARHAGYADADSFLNQFGADASGDNPEQAAHREMFENYQDSEYWSAIDRSERILGDVRGAGSNRDLARKVCGLMRDAYQQGRAARMEQTPASSPAP